MRTLSSFKFTPAFALLKLPCVHSLPGFKPNNTLHNYKNLMVITFRGFRGEFPDANTELLQFFSSPRLQITLHSFWLSSIHSLPVFKPNKTPHNYKKLMTITFRGFRREFPDASTELLQFPPAFALLCFRGAHAYVLGL